MKYLFTIVSLFIISVCYSQNIEPIDIDYFNPVTYNGKVKVSQDSQLENFMETHVGLNKKRRGFYGYRVKIYAQNHQNARSQANAIRLRFEYSRHKAYVTYTEPNFEVVVGDFTNRFEAVALLEDLIKDYPEAYIVKTIISYPNHNE
ncbi:MAG: hypothetical protein C0596_01640 [Marinilabiliales bacterium]|nr:MAG: hypothetical protein C0596_01640 [Marinilabiliales bacterium]